MFAEVLHKPGTQQFYLSRVAGPKSRDLYEITQVLMDQVLWGAGLTLLMLAARGKELPTLRDCYWCDGRWYGSGAHGEAPEPDISGMLMVATCEYDEQAKAFTLTVRDLKDLPSQGRLFLGAL